MAYVPGMPSSGIPEEERKKAEKQYEKRQKEQKQKEAEKQKEQEKKQTSPATNISVPGMPSGLPESVQERAQQQYDNRTNIQKQIQANNNYINSLTTSTLGVDANNVLNNTNIAQNMAYNARTTGIDQTFQQFQESQTFNPDRAYDTLPTDVRQKIRSIAYKSDNRLTKEVYKVMQSKEAEYQQRTLNDMAESRFWKAGETQQVSYATSIDYYNMQKRGFEIVYVEDGDGTLENKGGVFTIGRDKLAGLPEGTKVVMVDSQGNWRYIGNTTDRAKFVESMRVQQQAVNSKYNPKVSEAIKNKHALDFQSHQIEKQLDKLARTAERTRKQSDIDAFQAVLEQYNAINAQRGDAYNKIADISNRWANEFNYYEDAINSKTKWTVEDEARYQLLPEAIENAYNSINRRIRNNVHDSKAVEALVDDSASQWVRLLTEYEESTKRRNENKYAAAFMDVDAIDRLNKTIENMEKAVDEYNKWDSTTIHTEKGEDLGQKIKRIILRDLIGDTDSPVMDLGSPTLNYMATKEDVESANSEDIKKDLKALGESYYKSTVAPFIVAHQEHEKANTEIEKIKKKLDEGNLTSGTKYESLPSDVRAYYEQQMRYAEYAKIQQYTEAHGNASKQCAKVMFNNAVANLSVFDLPSVQSAFVAWRMAAHPDRYSNDPKFKKLQDAYQKIYGTNYRGAMDNGKMALAMLDIKSGKYGDDYVYVDGSDLRHESGEKYGLLASLAVGIGTDISAIAGLGKMLIGAAVKKVGAKSIVKASSDAFLQSLTRAEVSQEVAEEFVKSKSVQKAIKQDAKQAFAKAIRDGGGDETLVTLRQQLKERAEMFESVFKTGAQGVDEDGVIKDVLDYGRYQNFLRTSEELLSHVTDDVERSLLINKGTVIAHTLGTIDDSIDAVQKAVFRATCPAAGAVVGIAKSMKYIKEVKNLKLADTELLQRLAITGKEAEAQIAKLNFNSCLDGVMFREQCDNILSEFAYGAFGDIKHRLAYGKQFDQTLKEFSRYKDDIMRGVANSYVDRVVRDLRTTVEKSGLDGLEALATQNNFETFEDMFSTIKNNLELMYEHSPDARGIVDAFDNTYNTKVMRNKLTQLDTYVSNVEGHIHSIKTVVNIDGTSMLSPVNAELYPSFVQGIAKDVADTIHDFLYTVDNDLAVYTNASGNLASIHETGVAAIDALDKIVYSGIIEPADLEVAQEALEAYLDDVENVYLKNVQDFRADSLRDMFGAQDYIKNITSVSPDTAGNREVLDRVTNSMQKFFEDNGINISKDDIASRIIKSNPEDFVKMSMWERESVIYRIMKNKGSNAVGQISDSNLKNVTEALVDCNSQLNKNLRLIQMQLNDVKAQRITDAITNASAIENTRIIYNTLKLDGADSTFAMAVMDVLAGHSGDINRIVQANAPDIAVSKIRDYITREARTQLAKTHGSYSRYHNLMCDTVDVGANVINIEKNLGDYIPEDDNFIDICVSSIASTDGTAPKDIAFHLRGSSDAPAVFRKDTHFTVYDDNFASGVFGKSAQQVTEEYAALGLTGGMSRDEWQRGIQDFINKQKQIALDQNKTIRFIGFNSSDAISGGNRYLTDVLRSCGVSANMANAMDLADSIRGKAGEYIFDSKDIETLARGLREAVDNARVNSLTLDIHNVIAYDSKYTCADILHDLFDKHMFDDSFLEKHAEYISESMEQVTKNLGTEAYNDVGLVMGTYIDATEFAKVLEDAGLSSAHANGDIARIVAEAAGNGESQLGLHKIVQTAMDSEWLDFSKVADTSSYLSKFEGMERIHEAILQINQIHKNINRLDMITDADTDALKAFYRQMLFPLYKHDRSNTMLTIALALKVDELSAQQLYAVNKWLLDGVQRLMPADDFDLLFATMLAKSPVQASKLSDVGYRFISKNIVDYTDDSLDAFLVKYLDDSEEGYRFSQALKEIAQVQSDERNLKNYMDSVNALFKKENIHGVQDKMIAMQLAEIHRPIEGLRDEMKQVYSEAYKEAVESLAAEAKKFGDKLYKGSKKGNKRILKYSDEMVEKIATERGVRAAKQFIQDYGDRTRQQAVLSVANLNEEALKSHLIRNCCGGLIIDPASKCVQGVDLVTLFKRWESYGVKIDELSFTSGNITNRKLFRISLPELDGANMDTIFEKYNHARVKFENPMAYGFDRDLRHASFGASDMTLSDARHVDAFRSLFFNDGGTILDLNKNFKSWANELYSCNMWTDMDLKQLVNPYYTDNVLNNLAQNTHQMRNNISAAHDLGTIVNNRYMNTKYILEASGVLSKSTDISAQRARIVEQIVGQDQHLCKLILDKHNKFRVVDYTPKILKGKVDDAFFEEIINNTVMLDKGMMAQLNDWSKTTSMALKLQSSNAPEWLTSAYNIYKKTIRNGIVSLYLYLNKGTAIRNLTDSSTKGFNETLQFDQDVSTYFQRYASAVSDVHEYSNTYRQIEQDLGTVNHETIAKFFANDPEGLRKFNILYGYEHTCGGDSLLSELTLKESREEAVKYLMDGEGSTLDRKAAEDVRKVFDKEYGSLRWYGLTNAQLETHMNEIHDACMERLKHTFKDGRFTEEQLEEISAKFWNYNPTVATWGDKLTEFPILNWNKRNFNNAEVRARLAVYQTFLEGGASEFEAMEHVTATQFHYAGIGKVEDFMPFTQYKLYNALYWFEHADARAVSTAWRAAQYNGDGSMTNKEIAALISKYRQDSYYIYDAGADQDYDEYFQNELTVAGHILLDGVDSYLGLPREFSAGNLNLDGTHYLKLGNSFVEELDFVTTCAVGAAMFAATIGNNIKNEEGIGKLRGAYESFKYTPLYDSFYSPWKSYADLIAYAYDNEKAGNPRKLTSRDIWGYYDDFLKNKSTHSEAVSSLSIVGAVLSNMVGRWKSFDLNLGLLAALCTDPDSQDEMFGYIQGVICDTAGMFIPSLVGTKVDKTERYSSYGSKFAQRALVSDPTTFFDISARLQSDQFGFTEEQAKAILEAMGADWENGAHRNKREFFNVAVNLFSRGYTTDEITNLFKQHKIADKAADKRFLAMSMTLPNYLRYDKEARKEIIAYYRALGMSADAAWAKLYSNPAVIQGGRIVEISVADSLKLSKQRQQAYYAINKTQWTQEDWDAYFTAIRQNGFYYPKGVWGKTREYLQDMGYSFDEACALLLKSGFALNSEGKLVDVQGMVRRKTFSSERLNDAEWNAYWATLPDYTKYEKGAFGRTMKALKAQGYDDNTARALIQQGIYVDPNGTMMNVAGMERPVLGYANFNAYYQTLPDFIKYEKGAFKRTYAVLKSLGFDYETSLRLIQQGAYLMDATGIPNMLMGMMAKNAAPAVQRAKKDITVFDINTLMQKHGGTPIVGADGKAYIFVNCSGLQRARKTFGYSKRGYYGGGGRRGGGRAYGSYGYGGAGSSKRKPSYSPKLLQYTMRKPFIQQGNVSTYNGFTSYRGSKKLAKPYTTQGYVSTYSAQNFLNGSSYGMRKAYKIDMRQFKSGALSTKSAYPASYRNIAVAYRRNLYKDLYAKYGASRMQMRANKAGYSNASIVRLRRNEIYNRERYAERRDKKAKEKVNVRTAR